MVDQIVEVTRHFFLERIHHKVHPFLHHLHLRDNVGCSRVSDGWTAYVLPFQSTGGITTLWPLLVSSLSVDTFLVLLLSVMPYIPLTQLLFQIMILFGETFHYCREGLDLSLQGNGLRLVSLNVVGGRHRASKYHAILRPGSDSMANPCLPTDGAN